MEKGAQSRHLRLRSTSMGSPHHGFLPLLKLELSCSFWDRPFLPEKPLLAHLPLPAGFAVSHSSRHHGDLCLRADLLSDQSHVHLGCQMVLWNLKVTVRRFSGLNNVHAYVAITESGNQQRLFSVGLFGRIGFRRFSV